MVLQPSVYANLLKEKLNRHKAQCWLVNTGWGGGPFGVGKRISIAHTRAIINAILSGKLKHVGTKPDPIFGLHIPESCEGVPSEILIPRNTWKNPAEYDTKARELAKRFEKNFETFSATVSQEVCTSGPRVS
jgi:phosphoenolpyruvate carboxykinase (ATP)